MSSNHVSSCSINTEIKLGRWPSNHTIDWRESTIPRQKQFFFYFLSIINPITGNFLIFLITIMGDVLCAFPLGAMVYLMCHSEWHNEFRSYRKTCIVSIQFRIFLEHLTSRKSFRSRMKGFIFQLLPGLKFYVPVFSLKVHRVYTGFTWCSRLLQNFGLIFSNFLQTRKTFS